MTQDQYGSIIAAIADLRNDVDRRIRNLQANVQERFDDQDEILSRIDSYVQNHVHVTTRGTV